MTSDHELLTSFISRQDHEAFAEVVRRHVDLVYNACLRQTRGNRDLADDATQAVFLLLARRAGRISPRVVVAGWLYNTARYAAANALRSERRRRHHERRAGQAMSISSPPTQNGSTDTPIWEQAAPILDDAVNALPARDRDALLLRYFQGGSVRDVAVALGVSEETARQRVSRAVEKLRRAFARHGVTATAATVAAIVTGIDASPAPAAVAAASTAMATAGAGSVGVLNSIAVLARETLYMSRLKPVMKALAGGGAVITAVVAVTVVLAAQPATRPAPPTAAAHSPTTTTTTKPVSTTVPVDAASLVREVRAAEQWIDTVKSMRVKAETVWHAPPGAPAIPARPTTIVAGFDDHRLYYRADATEYELIDHRTWDGTVAVSHSKYDHAHHDQEQYVLDTKPGFIGEMQFGSFVWPRAGPHSFWWRQPQNVSLDAYGGAPEDFRVAGRERFLGVECYVVESDLHYTTLYVGIADHRMYGRASRELTRLSENSRGPIGREVANDMGAGVNDSRGLNAWLARLAPEQKDAYWKEYYRRMRPFSRPGITQWYADYRELAPGCWYPMHQGYDVWNSNADPLTEPEVVSQRDVRVTDAQVNAPLPDEWFVWTFDEGVELVDLRDDRKLTYKYKKHFEPAEWHAILDDAAQRKARMRPGAENIAFQIHRTDALGRQAPPFPTGATWINSPPITMADLKGKVVIIECFASWSKFSLDELAKVIDLHEHGKDGVVVVGVHAPGTPADEVRKWVNEHGITFPVCIDIPTGKGPWEGVLFNAYHVMDVPNAYVIDRAGRVTSEGTPGGAVTQAARATTRPTKRP